MTYHNHTWSIVRKGIKTFRHSLSKGQFATEKDALTDFQACMEAAGPGWRKALKQAEDMQDLGVYVDSSRRRRGEK